MSNANPNARAIIDAIIKAEGLETELTSSQLLATKLGIGMGIKHVLVQAKERGYVIPLNRLMDGWLVDLKVDEPTTPS